MRLDNLQILEKYKGHFIDKQHDLDILIEHCCKNHTYHFLKFEIDNIIFIGNLFDNFKLENRYQHTIAFYKFDIQKIGVYSVEQGNVSYPYSYLLQHYSLAIEIPIKLINKNTNIEEIGKFQISNNTYQSNDYFTFLDNKKVMIDRIECKTFKLITKDEVYSCDSSNLNFDDFWNKIIDKCKLNYDLVCCFTCQYASYGNSKGEICCWAEIYLNEFNREEFIDNLENDEDGGGNTGWYPQKNTYLCTKYKKRKRSYIPHIF